MEKQKPTWDMVYAGNLFEIRQNDRGWEKAVRAPGVRVVMISACRVVRYLIHLKNFRIFVLLALIY